MADTGQPERKMTFCYADPPYLGCGNKYDHPESHEWDDPARHIALAEELVRRYPDGFAISLSVPSLPIYQLALPRARVCAWVKPFAVYKPNVPVAYTWEPVLLVGGRPRTRQQPTVRDHLSECITIKTGLVGAKPLRFNQWILGLLNWQKGDTMVDMFPGTGGMQRAVRIGVHSIGGSKS